MNFAIHTLGCKVNQYDSGELASILKAHGWSSSEQDVDLVVINTCCVTQEAIRKSRRLLNQIKRDHPQAKIVLAGCWSQAYPSETKELIVDLVFPGRDWSKLLTVINKWFDQVDNSAVCQQKLISQSDRARYFIKIQDGCQQFCSYCIIPYTRGKLQSRQQQAIIAEVKTAVKSGYGEIVLSGIHLGLYGQDNNQGNLVELLEKLIAIEGKFRLRLSSIEVTEVSDELIKLLSKSDKLCQHLHISLQSGCNKILKAMNRPYAAEYFMKKIIKLRQAMPDIAITTDIIVGFPGETEADFAKTLNFVEQINFSKIHVFSFSPQAKTPAATMPQQNEKKIIARRSKLLRQLSEKLEQAYIDKFHNKKLGVVVIDNNQAKNRMIVKTEYFFDITTNYQKGAKIGGLIKLDFALN